MKLGQLFLHSDENLSIGPRVKQVLQFPQSDLLGSQLFQASGKLEGKALLHSLASS